MKKNQAIPISTVLLVFIIVLSILYVGLLAIDQTITGEYRLDGSIGVLFGLYICSHPVAFFVDVLFYRLLIQNRYPTRQSLGFQVALNCAILLFGWIIIVIGATRFTMPR